MAWPDDMFAGVGGPGSPGALDTYGVGLSDDDYYGTLAKIDEQLRAPAQPPEPPVNEPDAITQVMPPTPPQMQPGLGVPAKTFEEAVGIAKPEIAADQRADASADRQLERPIADVAPDYEATPLDLPTEAERSEALKKMRPEELAALEIKHELARRDKEATAQLEANRLEREQAERDHAVSMRHQQAREQEAAAIKAEAQKLYETGVNPDGWMESRSVPQMLAAIASVFIGGIGGGPNAGLQMINGAIERDIDAQKANLAHKRGLLADRRGALADQAQEDAAFERQANAYRIATYERALRDISAEQMKYDPQGTTTITLEKARRQIAAEQAKAYAKAVEDAAKRQSDALKQAFDLRKTAAETARIEAETAKLRGQLGGAGGTKEEDVVRSPEEWASLGVSGVPSPMSMKQLKKLQPLMKGGQELTKNEQEIEAGKATLSKEEREQGIPGIKNADGTPFIAVGRPEDVSKLRKAKSATETIVRRMDDALRTRTGWSSNIGNSDERAKLKAQWGQVKLAAKELFDLGAITESDVPLIEGAIGADDPSAWKDPTAAILEARRLVIEKLNSELHGAGWAADQRFDIKAPATVAPKETAETAAFKNAQRAVKVSDVKGDRPEIQTGADADAYLDATGGLDKYVRSDVQRLLDDLVDRGLSGDDAKKEDALGQLRDLVKTGGNSGVKDAARRAIAIIEGGGGLTPEEEARRRERKIGIDGSSTETVGGPKGSVVRDTVYGSPK